MLELELEVVAAGEVGLEVEVDAVMKEVEVVATRDPKY